MTRVVLIGAHSVLEQQTQMLLGDEAVALAPASTEALLTRLLRMQEWPQLVMLGVYISGDQAIALATALRQTVPTIGITGDPAAISPAAAAAGIDLALPMDAELDEVDALFVDASARAARQSAQLASPRERRRRGRIIVVTAPKGGVGKTTIATNTAIVLAALHPHETVLVDLDLQFGDVVDALALTPTRSIADAVGPSAARDQLLVKHSLTQHQSGLLVLAAPPSPATADRISASDVAILLRQLAQEFERIVIDTAPGLSEHTLTALDEADDVISITSPDITSVNGLAKELAVLRELDLIPDSHRVVLNLAAGGRGRVLDVEQQLGEPVHVVVPRSAAIGRSTNRGVPVVDDSPRDRAAGRLRTLGARLAHDAVPTRRSNRRKDAR